MEKKNIPCEIKSKFAAIFFLNLVLIFFFSPQSALAKKHRTYPDRKITSKKNKPKKPLLFYPATPIELYSVDGHSSFSYEDISLAHFDFNVLKENLKCKDFPLRISTQKVHPNSNKYQFLGRSKDDELPYCIFFDNQRRIPLFAVQNLKHYYFEEDQAHKTIHFSDDPSVRSSSGSKSAYYSNDADMDRGHLASAGDYLDPELKKMTYTYSNVAPQKRSFNQGVWQLLEIKIRKYAQKTQNELLVITGVGFYKKKSPEYLEGKHGIRVAIPHFFYKVIVDISKSPSTVVAYKMDNSDYRPMSYWRDNQEEYQNFLKERQVTLSDLEQLTGVKYQIDGRQIIEGDSFIEDMVDVEEDLEASLFVNHF